MNRRLLVIVAVLVLALGAAGAAALIQNTDTNDAATSPASTASGSSTSPLQYLDVAAQTLDGIPQKGYVLGYPEAPATLAVYADLLCPICREFDAGVLPDVITQLVRTKKLKLELRVWTIISANSVDAAKATWAAARQDHAWTLATITYLNQGDEAVAWFDDAFAHDVATASGLDPTRFDADRANPAAQTEIERVDTDATERKFTGTPSLLLTGPGGEKVVEPSSDVAALAAAVAAISVR